MQNYGSVIFGLFAFNIVLLISVLYLFVRLHRRPKDNPRLSRGLQMLQSKISVLEDLSDKIDKQANDVTLLSNSLFTKIKQVITEAETNIENLEKSVERGRKMAWYIKEDVPHKEIIESRKTRDYIKAAQLAHQGLSIEDIKSQVDIPDTELKLLVKLNRKKLIMPQEGSGLSEFEENLNQNP